MSFITILLIAIGLSMDSLAVSISGGICMKPFCIKKSLKMALTMGIFQGGMTWLGWAMGIHFSNYITDFDHWIAFVLLSYLGGKMVYESFKEEDSHLITFSSRMLFTLGVATSIDALAVGVSMAFLKTGIWFPASVIAFTTFFLSFSGVICGFRFGKIKGLKVELLGGLILIVIGVKILIEHTLLDQRSSEQRDGGIVPKNRTISPSLCFPYTTPAYADRSIPIQEPHPNRYKSQQTTTTKSSSRN